MKVPWLPTTAVLLAAACGSGSSPHPQTAAAAKVSMAGTVQVAFVDHATATEHFKISGTSCVTTGSLAAVRQGTSITIFDASGKIVGTASLSAGQPDLGGGGADVFKNYCRFDFTADVDPAEFYKVQVAQMTPVVVKRADAASIVIPLGA